MQTSTLVVEQNATFRNLGFKSLSYNLSFKSLGYKKKELGYRKIDAFPTDQFLFHQNYTHSLNSFWKQSHLTIGNGGRPPWAGALPKFLKWFLKAKPQTLDKQKQPFCAKIHQKNKRPRL